MPVPASKYTRSASIASSIPRPRWNQPSRTEVNKEEQRKTRVAQPPRARPSSALVRSNPGGPSWRASGRTSTALDSDRSRLCLANTRALDSDRSRLCLPNAPALDSDRSRLCPANTRAPRRSATVARTGREGAQEPQRSRAARQAESDDAFLRKLLALNKKQEMMINVRLAEVMRGERPRPENPRDGEKRNGAGSPARQSQRRVETAAEYDLNGRRVYRYGDEELAGAETWIANTTRTCRQVIETTADGVAASRAVSQSQQSVTVIKQPPRGPEEASEAGGERVVVHCVGGRRKESARNRLVKVWNYKSLLGGDGDASAKSAESC